MQEHDFTNTEKKIAEYEKEAQRWRDGARIAPEGNGVFYLGKARQCDDAIKELQARQKK